MNGASTALSESTTEARTMETDIPYGVAVTSDGKHAYDANGGSASVSVIDTATNTVAAAIPVATAPIGVAVTRDGKRASV